MFISYYFDNFSLIKESILYYLLRSKDVIYYNSSIQDQKCSKSQVLTFLLIFFSWFVCECRCVHAMPFSWRAEDSFQELVLTPHLVELGSLVLLYYVLQAPVLL